MGPQPRRFSGSELNRYAAVCSARSVLPWSTAGESRFGVCFGISDEGPVRVLGASGENSAARGV